MRPAVRIAYVVDQFPRGTHGFLLQEILELESRGIDVHIFSLRMPEGRVDDTACAQLQPVELSERLRFQ